MKWALRDLGWLHKTCDFENPPDAELGSKSVCVVADGEIVSEYKAAVQVAIGLLLIASPILDLVCLRKRWLAVLILNYECLLDTLYFMIPSTDKQFDN